MKYKFTIKRLGLTILREDAGVFSTKPIWVCFQSCYFYSAPTLPKLLWIVITEWKHDRHLAM